MPAVGSVLLSFGALILWMLLTESFMARFGVIMSESVEKSFWLMALYIVMMPLCGAAFQLILTGFCSNSKVAVVLSNAGITLVMCLTGGFLSLFAMSFAAASKVSPEYIYCMIPCIRGLLIMVPLVQGALFLCAVGRGWKKCLVMQVSMVICFLLLTVVAEVLTVMFLHLGAVGIFLSAVTASVVIVIISLISQLFK